MTTFAFGNWLQTQRKQRGLSRRQVAERSGHQISQQYIHFIETGRATNIGSDKLLALGQGLGVPTEVLQYVLTNGHSPELAMTGRVAAGPATQTRSEEYSERLAYDPAPDPTPDDPASLFAVEVVGDSMAPKIAHGDWALVRRYLPGEPLLGGHVYLIREGRAENGKTTCKYLIPNRQAEGGFILRAEQAHLFADTPLEPTHHTILGRVFEVRKSSSLSCPIL